jgi:hypothetical protein
VRVRWRELMPPGLCELCFASKQIVSNPPAHLAELLVPLQSWGVSSPLRRKPRRPQVGWFHNVAVTVDNRRLGKDVAHQISLDECVVVGCSVSVQVENWMNEAVLRRLNARCRAAGARSNRWHCRGAAARSRSRSGPRRAPCALQPASSPGTWSRSAGSPPRA